MTMYGLYVRDQAADDFIWFTTERSLQPGAYMIGRHHGTSPEVYVLDIRLPTFRHPPRFPSRCR